ncbi:hypothetical protein ACERK3_08420 [Phycisphaerales bacterium AB-hyl4]|uniref:Uncharacterized protein n=1 Tax=Natronomicrosphaera hydrolytica TaxID=3242702 RepID=A0ABV4U685_9BACT
MMDAISETNPEAHVTPTLPVYYDDPDWWERPFAFDITPYVKWDEPNVITVLVNDFHLDGGIWKSVFLHLMGGPGMFSPEQ